MTEQEQKAFDLMREALTYYRDECTGHEPSLSVFQLKVDEALAAANAVSHPKATELAGWTGKSDIDAALIMLDRLDVRGEGDDARVDEISRTLRKLAAAPEAKQ